MATLMTPLVLRLRADDGAATLSQASGLIAVTALTAALVLPSRMRSPQRTSGIERSLRAHRHLGLLAMTLMVVHLGLVMIESPAGISLDFSADAPPHARAVTASAAATTLMGALAVTRRRVRMRYEIWRALHVVLSLVIVGGAALHLFWLNRLVRGTALRYGLLGAAVVFGLMIGNRWIRPLVTSRAAFVVDSTRQDPCGISTVVLTPDQRRIPSFQPGQFAWLRLDHKWGPKLAHPFTIACGTDVPGRIEFTVQHPDASTSPLIVLQAGRRVYVDGPYDPSDDHHQGSLLLVAADHGISPMMSILRAQAARHDRRPHCLLVEATGPSDLQYRQELQDLGRQLDLDVVEVLSHPAPTWTGRRGRIDSRLLEEVIGQHPSLTAPHAYVCGPPRMISDVTSVLVGLGLSARRIHTEQFELV